MQDQKSLAKGDSWKQKPACALIPTKPFILIKRSADRRHVMNRRLLSHFEHGLQPRVDICVGHQSPDLYLTSFDWKDNMVCVDDMIERVDHEPSAGTMLQHSRLGRPSTHQPCMSGSACGSRITACYQDRRRASLT